MAIVGDYTTQQMRELILKFYPGGYTPQTFGNVTLNWQIGPDQYHGTGNLTSAITAMGLYQETTYTYLKYCENYIIGYTQYGVQIIKGRCHYGGIRDLAAFLNVWEKVIYSTYSDLSANIAHAFIVDLPAEIDIHSPADLLAYLNVLAKKEKDLSGSIHGWVEAYLSAYIKAMTYRSLPAYLNPISPVDLSAYLKVWPMSYLSADIYGWQTADLSAFVTTFQAKDLPTTIDIHPWVNLGVLLKGWGRGVISNLSAFIGGFGYKDLTADVRATYLKHISGYINVIQPVHISANIYGWNKLDLPAYLNGVYGLYDLQATIISNRNMGNLPASLRQREGVEVPVDLPARTMVWQVGNMMAYINGRDAVKNLSAYLTATGQIAELPASIYPKTVRLTSIVNVATMEHLDLSGVINPSCIWSEPRNLLAYIRCVYKSDLGATLLGKKYDTMGIDLPTKIGYIDTYSYIDRLPVYVNVAEETYRYIDKLPIAFKIFVETKALSASIVGTYLNKDLTATLTAVRLEDYHFESTKDRVKVYNLDYMGLVENYEVVELTFKNIVKDYFYSSAGSRAWKTDRLDKWILDLASYIPANTALNVKRKLHKIKSLYDIEQFSSIDEAVRFAIDYVTSYPYSDMSARINSIGKYTNLMAYVTPIYSTTETSDLLSQINGVGEPIAETVVVGFIGSGIDIV